MGSGYGWLREQGEGSKLRAEGGKSVAKSTVVLSASYLEADADGKVAAPAQFSMQKAAMYLDRRGKITCGADHAVRVPQEVPSRALLPPFIQY